MGTKQRPLRADARDNRDRILAAAREVFVEQGPGAPLEEISRRAGVEIAARVGAGQLYGIDRDPLAVALTRTRLADAHVQEGDALITLDQP